VRADTEQQVTEALGRMGIPSRSDIEQLDAKITVLTRKIDAFGTTRRTSRPHRTPPSTPEQPA
jgi:hypothetical protein